MTKKKMEKLIIPASKQAKPPSPIVLPSAGTEEVLPADAFNKALKLEKKTLQELGVKSEDDFGDDLELERSSIDGACVVSVKKNNMLVCWYCFKPFAKGHPEFEPAEMQVGRPDGSSEGTRVKVHAACLIKEMRKLQRKRRGG